MVVEVQTDAYHERQECLGAEKQPLAGDATDDSSAEAKTLETQFSGRSNVERNGEEEKNKWGYGVR